MKSSCPYTHVSYATWRLRTFRRLCFSVDACHGPRLQFPQPPSAISSNGSKREFHNSGARRRGKTKELMRNAKYKAVQLELGNNIRSGVKPEAESTEGQFDPQSIHSQLATQSGVKGWNPYTESSLEEINNLVGDLRVMAKKAVKPDEEGIPFEGSLLFKRKRAGGAISPLERKPRWDRDTKLQVHEVEVDKRLENNVWAQLLASPARQDRGTKARLPRDIMASWGMIRNPHDNKDYILPIELSDVEALRHDLQQTEHATNIQQPVNRQSKSRAGGRISILDDRLLLQAMTREFSNKSWNPAKTVFKWTTLEARIANSLIPYQWKTKQQDYLRFQRTRQAFNETLGREPDPEEPDLADMSRLARVQWQHDIASRVEKIIGERILMVLEAMGKANVSGRAVHDRRVLAFPVPSVAQFFLDERGRLTSQRPSDIESAGINLRQDCGAHSKDIPNWVHGAVLLHTGNAEQFRKTIEQWHQSSQALHTDIHIDLEQLPFDDLVPPMITVNDKFRLPVFNLESLLGSEQSPRIRKAIETNKIFTLDFWLQRDQNAGPRVKEEDSNFESDIGLNVLDPVTAVPISLADAGEQVISSIVTPGADIGDSALASQHPSPSSTSTVSASKDEEPYLILLKPEAHHATTLTREIWIMWRYIGGRSGCRFDV